jgi:tetratricopeptide (TPR) repeat protein
MSKKTHPVPPLARRAQGAAAFAAAWLLLGGPIFAADGTGPPVFAPDGPAPPQMLAPLPPESALPRAAVDSAPERGEAPTKRDRLDGLFDALAASEPGEYSRIAADIGLLWSHSGSDTMDLLLRRGRMAIEAGELVRAVHHLTALTDHAPAFPEGWNARATAFYMMDRWGLALADIEQVLALEPRHFGALTGLAVIMEKLDRPADALAAWRQALAVHPHLDAAAKAVERLSPKVDGRGI